MKQTILSFFLFLLLVSGAQARRISVLQWNIWQEGTKVEGGYEAIVNEIARLQPDFVTLSEVRNYRGTRFCDRILSSLKERGLTYYSFFSPSTAVLSRYPVEDSLCVFPLKNDHGSIHKLVARVGQQEVAVYSAHLDYLDDAYYNVRGVDGSTWKPVEIPTSVAEVLERNDRSRRDEAIRAFLTEAEKDIKQQRIVILGGDFNEPSHLDWTRQTKDLYDHHGFIVPWTVTLLLDNAGFVDAYRTCYPNVLTHPGFTFPSDNPSMEVKKLTWAPLADERDRIDYIFYYPHPSIRLKKAAVFGPSSSIVRSERVAEQSKDRFIKPLGVWPTDHKGVWAVFDIKE